VVAIRRYQPQDLEDCRSLWADLTTWHRELYLDSTIGGDDRGAGFDAHLAEVGRNESGWRSRMAEWWAWPG